MIRGRIGAWWRRLAARRVDPTSTLSRAWPRRWVVGYLEVCVFVGALTLVTEVVATSTGEAASLPNALFVSTYLLAPVVYFLLFAFAVAATLFVLFAPFAVPRPAGYPLRALAEAGCVWASFALPIGIRSEEHTSELQSRQYLVCR